MVLSRPVRGPGTTHRALPSRGDRATILAVREVRQVLPAGNGRARGDLFSEWPQLPRPAGRDRRGGRSGQGPQTRGGGLGPKAVGAAEVRRSGEAWALPGELAEEPKSQSRH